MQTRQAEKFVNSNRHYSLRKLSVGLASVLIGISFLNGTKTTVKADTITASTKTGEVSKAGNLEVAGDSKDLSAFSMSFNGKNDENETAKADTTSDQTTQTGDQAEAQENRLVNQINYKLTNNGSTDNNQDLGQNKVAPDETKQTSTIKSDAEKNIVGSSSTQKINNQLNDHAENNSQTQPQNSQKLDITKNSQKFAKKVLATNLIETTSSPTTNGGFDEATWGKLDVNDWQGSAQDGVYQLTGYTGDKIHIIVPNEADFEKAGKSTNGLQVGITRDTVQSLLSEDQTQTIAFSKTSNQKVKAIDDDWAYAFAARQVYLSKFDGSGLDVSNVTDMSGMFNGTSFGFFNDKISDLTSLANWDTSKVTDMSNMFEDNTISDLTPLANWNVSNVRNMGDMFKDNSISDLAPLTNWNISKVTNMSDMFGLNKISDLTLLTNWKTSNVTDMSYMFEGNKISDLTPLVANWDVSKVTDMSNMFAQNPNLKDVKPITNWNMSSIADWGLDDLFEGDAQLDLTDTDMRSFLKKHGMSRVLQGSAFLTNDVDFVKANLGKTLSTLTNTATRTIVFNFPDGTSNTITQTIYYKTKTPAPAQIYWPAVSRELALMALNSPLLAKNTPVQADPDDLTPVGPGGLIPVGPGGLIPVGPDEPNPYNLKLIKIYTENDIKDIKASDWQLDTSKTKDAITVNGQVYFKPVPIPHINGYKPYIMKDPVNPAMFLVSFFAVPRQSQNNQSNNVQLPQKPVQPEQTQPEQTQPEQTQPEQTQPEQTQPEQKQSEQKQSEQKQPEQKQPEQKQPEQKQPEQKQSEQKQSEQKQPEQKPAQSIQARPADDKQVDQTIDHISYTLMHSDSTFDKADNFEPAQNDSASLENISDSTQKDDAAKPQKVNAAKPKKHIAKKHVVKRHKKHAKKKYHLKRRSRKHTKRSRHAKKRLIKHRKRASRKFRKYNLKHIKKA